MKLMAHFHLELKFIHGVLLAVRVVTVEGGSSEAALGSRVKEAVKCMAKLI